MLREQFPILSRTVGGQPLIYLDNAATTQKPQPVIDALTRYYSQSNANVHRASHHLSAEATAAFEQARAVAARFLNASSSREIIWTRGTTEAINLVAHSWGLSQLKAGDEIILSTLEHHANIVPWQMVAARTGARIRVIPLLPNGDLDLEAYYGLLSDRTRMVAVGHVSNALGTVNPVAKIARAARQVGARVLIDGAQATPHFEVDVQALDCDFYAFSGHKLYGPTGIGVLWGREALLEQMPPWQGGGEMIERVSFSGTTYQRPPFRFEAGTPNISGVIGLGAALEWLSQQDRNTLAAHEEQLLEHALNCCATIPGFLRIGTPAHSVSLLSFRLAHQHQQDIGLLLDQQGIAVRTGHHCAMPLMESLGINGTTRASFAFYNTLQEVERFARVLEQIATADKVQLSVPDQTIADTASPGPDESDFDSRYMDSPYGREISADALAQKLLTQRDWNGRYRELMLLGKALPSLPAELKVDNHRVSGCESDAWLLCQRDSGGTLHFLADADARVIRGLIALVLACFNHRSAEQIRQFDIETYFNQLELARHLSPSRGNGLRAIIERIRQFADEMQ